MNLYIMRHGETDWNRQGRLQGSEDIPLNEYGVALAQKTREGLEKEQIHFDRVFTSPYKRARKTAEIMIGGDDIPLIADPRIREMSFGKYEGIKVWELGVNPAYREFSKCFDDPEHYISTDGVESYPELFARVDSFLTEVILPLEGACENVLVVCHGAVVRAFISIIKHMPLSEYWSGIHQQNCSVNMARVKDGRISMVEMNRLYYQPEIQPERRFV